MDIALKDMKLIRDALHSKVNILQYDPKRDERQYQDYKRLLDTFEELMRARGFARRCFRRPSSWNPGKIPEEALSGLITRLDALDAMAQAVQTDTGRLS